MLGFGALLGFKALPASISPITMAGVVDVERVAVVGDNSATGEHAVAVGLDGGSEGDRLAAPRHHILGGHVPPVHGAPHRGVGVVLEIDVVAALEIDEAVGVVDPSRCGGDVERGVPAVVAALQELRDARLGLLKLFLHYSFFRD